MVFNQPVNIGDVLNLKARLCYVGHSSMDIEVEIEAEKLKEGKTVYVGAAYLTMVALDECFKPTEAPRLILKTKREKLKAKLALARRKKRLSEYNSYKYGKHRK
jgi:acyl-CoA hydrolase